MTRPVTIPDAQWNAIYAFLRAHRHVHDYGEENMRRFVEGVLYITRSGGQWRLLPSDYGNWNSIYKRFARWCELGVWEALHQHCIQEPDLEAVFLDSTSVRAHPCAAGASAQKGGNTSKRLDAVEVVSAPRFTSVLMPWATRSPTP